MKITRMKLNKPTDLTLVSQILQDKLAQKGFITEVNLEAGKIGLRMRSFRIDVNKIGYNAKIGIHVKTKTGYKRTDVPTWEQREEFNHIVNKVFDKYKINAKIVSGPYLIRDHINGAIKEWQCVNYMGHPSEPNCSVNGFGQVVDRLMTLKEAQKYVKELV